MFWLGQKGYHGLTNAAILPFVPDMTLEEFDPPNMSMTVDSDSDSDTQSVDQTIGKRSSKKQRKEVQLAAKPRRSSSVSSRRVSWADPVHANSDPLTNLDPAYATATEILVDSGRGSPDPSYTTKKVPSNKRKSTSTSVPKVKKPAMKKVGKRKKRVTQGKGKGNITNSVVHDATMDGIMTAQPYNSDPIHSHEEGVSADPEAPFATTITSSKNLVSPNVKDAAENGSLSVGYVSNLPSPPAKTADQDLILYDTVIGPAEFRGHVTGAIYSTDVHPSVQGVSDAELLGEDCDAVVARNTLANAATYQGFSGGAFHASPP